MSDVSDLPNVPRYTSYPTAPHFSSDLAVQAHSLLLQSITPNEPVSVYLHIPFCDRLCWFCGCHTKHTLKYAPVSNYVGFLVDEIRQFAERAEFKPKLGHVHFGGGSPSMLQLSDAQMLNEALHVAFDYSKETEVAVEIDPNDIVGGDLSAMLALGITRASIGVQDFDEQVQAAINRPQSFDDTAALVRDLRHEGIKSVNIDALYGLPYQTNVTIRDTANKVVTLEPDRIAQFGYAHVPHLKKHQNMIEDASLPDNAGRYEQSQIVRSIFVEAGYEEIGIDHFAKPGDSLTVASNAATMRRNFQGYTTDNCRTLLGFGASSISSCNSSIVQNTVPTHSYQEQVKNEASTAARGIVLSRDDQIRAAIIESLMCNFRIDFDELAATFGEVDQYRSMALQTAQSDLKPCCTYSNSVLAVGKNKRAFTRLVASRFDAYLNTGASTYSKAV